MPNIMESNANATTSRERAEQRLLQRMDDTYRRRRHAVGAGHYACLLLVLLVAAAVMVLGVVGDAQVHPYGRYSQSLQTVNLLTEML